MPKVKKESNDRTIPYARGFRPVTAKQQLSALGFKTEASVPLQLRADPKLFQPIPKCTSEDDWLAQYREHGQTYREFMVECPWLSTRQRKCMAQKFNPRGSNLPEKYYEGKIYVLPLGDFNSDTMPPFSELMEYAEIFYNIPVRQLEGIELEVKDNEVYWVQKEVKEKDRDLPEQPASSSSELVDGRTKNTRKRKAPPREKRYKLKSRYDAASGHRQLCVDGGLLKLKRVVPDDAICVIALTSMDLYADEPDLFVAGMAAGGFRVAIFSLFRYDPNMTFSPEFWHEIEVGRKCEEEERKRTILLRSCRLLVHELAHLLGIDHCINYACCMNGAGHLAEDFSQPMFLCPVDLRKVQTLCGFNVVERYEDMCQFFTKHGMSEQTDWIKARLKGLQS